MSKSRIRTALYGAIGGGVLGLVALVLVSGRYALGSIVSTPVVEGTARATTEFAIASGGLYLAVIVVGLLGGTLIAGISYGVNLSEQPDVARFPLRYMMTTASVVGAIAAYALMRGGIGAFGDITAGVVTIGALQITLVFLVVGLLAGTLTADVVGRLSNPELLKFEGAAWPSRTAVIRDMARAVGTPIVSLVTALAVAIPFSQVLIAFHGTMAVALFSILGSLVLGGAALLAYRPWDRNAA